MKEDSSKKLSELIELHLELKGEPGAGGDGQDELDGMGGLPPRKELFPSNRPKWTKIFYNTLFALFLLLVAGLTVWGFRMHD